MSLRSCDLRDGLRQQGSCWGDPPRLSGTTPGQMNGGTAIFLYQHSDHLTTRLTTDNSGQVANEQAHYPYGEGWYATGTADPSVLRKFTTYEKDGVTSAGQLHYAIHRTHGARIGRFLRPDPVRGRVRNPQRLNRYAYVTGDPTNRRDPRGLDDFDLGGGSDALAIVFAIVCFCYQSFIPLPWLL